MCFVVFYYKETGHLLKNCELCIAIIEGK